MFESLRARATRASRSLLIEQYVERALGFADEAVILRHGRRRLARPSADARRRARRRLPRGRPQPPRRGRVGGGRTSGSCRTRCAGTPRSPCTLFGPLLLARGRLLARCVAHLRRARARHRRRAACGRTRSRARRARASGAATTATSATPGIRTSSSSTSSALTFSPPRMMMSFLRSTIDELAVLVEHTDVAGAEPAVVVDRRLRELGVGVPDEAVGTLAPDLARLADADDACRRRRAARSRRRAAGAPSVLMRFSSGSSCVAPVIDGCSVEPKLRTIDDAQRSARRSPTVAGTGEPPSPMRGIIAACSGVKSGWSRRLVRKYVAPLTRSTGRPRASPRAPALGSHTSMR